MMTFSSTVRFVIETCCNQNCGIAFGIPEDYADKKRETHADFFCPNGHGQHYLAQTEAEKWKAEFEREQVKTAFWRNDARLKDRRLSATRGQITKIKQRIANGVCPCCKRTFSDLARHMQHQHPTFKSEVS